MIILERFEGNYAFVEIDGEIIDVEKYRVSECVKEGDGLKLEDWIYHNTRKLLKRGRSIYKISSKVCRKISRGFKIGETRSFLIVFKFLFKMT